MTWYTAPTLDVLLAEVDASAPGRDRAGDGSIGDPSHSSRDSDHNPDGKGCVHARDFTHDPAGGLDAHAFAEWIRTQVNAGLMRIGYVISNGRIYNPDHGPDWRPYTGTNPHTSHVHVSIRYDHRENDPSPWGWAGGDDMTPDESASLAECRRMLAVLLGAIPPASAAESVTLKKIDYTLENTEEARRMGGVLLAVTEPAGNEQTIAEQVLPGR